MAPLLDQLLWPQRVLEGLLKEIGRFATAAERVARSSEEIAVTFKSIEQHLASIDDSFEHDLPARLERLHEAFDRSNEEIESFRDVMRPIVPEIAMTREAVQAADVRVAELRATLEPAVEDLDEVKDTVEPLQPAARRVGRLAQRLPGKD